MPANRSTCEYQGGDLIIGDRPLDPIAIPGWVGEFVMAPARTGPTPNERFASHLVAPDPVEGLFLDIGMVFVLDEEMRRILAETGRRRDQREFSSTNFRGDLLAVRKFPWGTSWRWGSPCCVRRCVPFRGRGSFSPSSHNSLAAQPPLDSRSDHDGIECMLLTIILGIANREFL